jgi:ankyrin repeat protein
MAAARVSHFFDACAAGDVGQLRQLLDAEPDLVRAVRPTASHGGWTGLHEAAKGGHTEAVKLLLARGADPNAREAGDNTYPLHWAAAHTHVQAVRALLDAGGDVHGRGDIHELDAIGWASFFRDPHADPTVIEGARRDTVALLLERGARHHIFSAMSMDDAEAIRTLVAENPDALNRRMSRFERGQTPLHFAIDRRRYDLLDLLIALGADVDMQDRAGQTALSSAMLKGDREAVRRLRAAGATPPPVIERVELTASMARIASSVKKGVPMIYAPDVARALDWYVSIGFTEIARFGQDGQVNFGMVSFGGAELMLNMHGKEGRHDASLWLYTDNVDGFYQLLKARQLGAVQAAVDGEGVAPGGIEFSQDIEDMFYGARQFCIRDLNGYELYFIQHI